MKILVVGSGGREAVLAWKMAQSLLVEEVWVTPHHPAACLMHPKIRSGTHPLNELVSLKRFQLAVIGPELPLSQGVAEQLRARGIPTVGPSAQAAQLETSKSFAKTIMQAAGIPTARAEAFCSLPEALAYLEKCPWEGIVVKADGPAAGKGVVVCENKAQAASVLTDFFNGNYLGERVDKVLLEEKLTGTEISAFALCHETNALWLGSARDHKRLLAGDLGPNTGGMGTVSPVSDFSPAEQAFVEQQVFQPVLLEMKNRGVPFQGFLFAGLMRTSDGLKVLEFNVRLGDPEAQVLLPLIESDLVPWLLGCATQAWPQGRLSFSQNPWVHVVLCAPGYPGTDGRRIRLGDEIKWPKQQAEQLLVIPAGMTQKEETWVSRGGRILGVSACGQDVPSARQRALEVVQQLAFPGAQWRIDIGGE